MPASDSRTAPPNRPRLVDAAFWCCIAAAKLAQPSARQWFLQEDAP